MAGSYIDPCGSGAFEGSGSWDTGSTGSWSGSGSGNDQLTGSNCCASNPKTNGVCCISGSLKLKLFALHPQTYTDPSGDIVKWSEIEDSRIYTLQKTIFCDDNGGTKERWVIEDPDIFSIFGNLAECYYEDSMYTFSSAPLEPSSGILYFPKSNISGYLNTRNWCKCYSSVYLTEQQSTTVGPVENDSLPKCSNTFLAKSYTPGNFYAMIWSETTNLEDEFGISESPPSYVTVSTSFSNLSSSVPTQYYHSDNPANYTAPSNSYYRRVWTGEYYLQVPFYNYRDCRYPFISGYPGVPASAATRNYLRQNYLAYIPTGYFNKYSSPAWANPEVDTSTLTCLNYNSTNNTSSVISKTSVGAWKAYINTGYYNNYYSAVTVTRKNTNCYYYNSDAYANWFLSCATSPLSIKPVYDVLLDISYSRVETSEFSGTPINNCIPNISGVVPPFYNQIAAYSRVKFILTEGAECPPYTYSGSLPGPTSGSTPVSGSAPTSGSTPGSGSGSGSGSAPVTCYGGCAYNITSYVSGGDGYGWNWILTGTYAGNVCSTGCGCSNTGTITFSYWGPEGGWPNPLYFPCDPGAGGGSGGSSGSGSGSSSGSGSGSSSGSGSTSGGSTSSSGSGFIMVPF